MVLHDLTENELYCKILKTELKNMNPFKSYEIFSTSSHLLKTAKIRVTINRFLSQNALFCNVIKGNEILMEVLNPNNLVVPA